MADFIGIGGGRARPDLPAVGRIQAPEPERQARDLWGGRPPGRRCCLPFHGSREGRLRRLAWPLRTSFRYFLGLPPDWSNSLQGKNGSGRGHVPPAPLAVLQENADRARL